MLILHRDRCRCFTEEDREEFASTASGELGYGRFDLGRFCRYADAGATVAELEALFGWHGGGMASLYTRDADRRRLAQQAAGKLAPQNKKANSIPAPGAKVQAPAEK